MDLRHAISQWSTASVLLLAMVTLALLYRISVPPAALCADAMLDTAGTRLALPLRIMPGDGGSVLTLHQVFAAQPDAAGVAVYISHAAPLYRLAVNGRDLTPEVDFARHDRRSRGPQLHVLAPDLLHAGDNRLTLQLPLASDLGDVRLGQVCVGGRATLQAIWLANWWRQTGIPATCLALLAILGLIATTLALLQRELPLWRWYIICVVLAACRLLYVLSPVMPFNADAWRAVSDLSMVLFVFAMYRLLLQFWAIPAHRWSSQLLLGTIVVRAIMTFAGLAIVPAWELAYWLSVAVIAGGFVIELSIRARHAPLVERASLRWTLGFVIGCAVLETVTKYLLPLHSTVGIYPLGTTLLIVVLGVLLARRASAGTRLLGQAARMLGRRIDHTLLTSPAASARVWDMVSGELAHDERQYMLDVISDGFGARMLGVLERIRQQNPDSQLTTDIQRALLDLRLMIDAIDGSTQSLGNALATLRLRMDAPLAAAGITSQWDIDGVSGVQIGSRRRLTELFRCIEELLSNVIQHARARQVQVGARVDGGAILIEVVDDGCGRATDARAGRGLRNVQLRMAALHGQFQLAASPAGNGTCAQLRLPDA